jgi:hypothetical protein
MDRKDLLTKVCEGWVRMQAKTKQPLTRILLSVDLYEIVREEVERGEDPFGLGVPVTLSYAPEEPASIRYGLQVTRFTLNRKEVEAAIPGLDALETKKNVPEEERLSNALFQTLPEE